MNLSEPFIRRPIMTTLVMVAILQLGIMAYNRLPVSNLPDVDYPTISVTALYPGSSPETMANTIASPMEQEFMTIPGIETVTSTNTLGNTNIVLQFEISKSMDSAAQDVQAAIFRSKAKLPPNLPNDPTYQKVNPSETPIMYIALTSDTVNIADLYTYAHTYVGQRLSMIDGVAQVTTYGSPYAVRVQVDPGKLASLSITLEDVAKALAQGNANLPTGILDGKDKSSNIITKGQLLKAKDYQSLIIKSHNDAPVRLRDLGQAIDSVQNNRFSSLYVDHNKKQPTAVLAVKRQPGSNTVAVSNKIEETLPALLKELPATVDMKIVFDRSDSVKESIQEVKFTLVIALFLVVFVIFIYLGKVRDTVIPSLVMPMSIVATFIFMHLLGYTIDNLSLLALTLAIGFIIDDAIVVLENIVRRVELGENPWNAALEGSKQISFTILSMTISLVAVFIPMLFMPGLIGKIFGEFAVTLMVVTLTSGIISLTLTPMLCSRFIPPHGKEKSSKMTRFSERLNSWMLDLYKPSLHWALKHGALLLGVGAASVVFSGYLLYSLPTDFIPDDDIGFIIAFNQAAEGTSSEKMIDFENQVIQAIQKDPSITSFVSIAAFPQYRNGLNFIMLKPRSERPPINQVIGGMYGKLGGIPGLNTYIKNVPLIDLSTGQESRGAYQYTLQSLNPQDLYTSAENLLNSMRQDLTFQGVSSNLEVHTPQLDVNILRDQASTLGVTAEQIESTFLLAYSGNRVSRIETPVDQYDVILELERSYQNDPSAFSSIYVRSENSNRLVPLNALAEWKEGIGPNSINHLNQFPAVTISFNVAPGIPLGTALDKLRVLAKESLSTGVQGKMQGAAQTFENTIRNCGFLLLMAVFAIYIVLGILYESFVHPLTILSTLPPALLGGLLTLYFLGLPLSLYAYLGLILLIGIVKKNGIMVVDFALENIRNKNETPENAIFDACIVRFRPIMMTTIATIAGALPIALAIGGGAAARRPLGMVIIGGLLLSQLVTLFLTPVIYLYLERLHEKLSFRKTAKAS